MCVTDGKRRIVSLHGADDMIYMVLINYLTLLEKLHGK